MNEKETDTENMTTKEEETKDITTKEKEAEDITVTEGETETGGETENINLEKEDNVTASESETESVTESETESETQNTTESETETEVVIAKEETESKVVKEKAAGSMTLKEKHFETSIQWLTKKSASSIKTNSEGYEAPKSFTNKETGEKIQPDFSFETQSGYTSFTDIALKSESPRKLVTRWKLLSMMANAKRGKLHLLTPKGHKMFTKKLVDNHNINALIHSI